MTSAFVIIDAQGTWTKNNPYTAKAIKRAVNIARQAMPVLWVYYTDLRIQFASQAGKVKDNSGFAAFNHAVMNVDEYKPDIVPEPQDWIVTKAAFSMFANPATERILKDMDARDLIFAGFETSACLHFSASEAVLKGYTATAIPGLIADDRDRNYPDAISSLQTKGVQIGRPDIFTL